MKLHGREITDAELGRAIEQWQCQTGDQSAVYAVFERHARAGQVEAQFVLGTSYATGRSPLLQDRAMAIHWLEQAIAGGHPTAPLHMALMFDPTNELVAASEAAAEVAAANYRLGFQRCKEGADAGVPELMAALAGCYSCGWGVAQDQALASLWRERAIATGYHGQQ